MFWFSRDTLQYAEITTQEWHSTWNKHLDHYADVIPITDLHMPTVRMEGISSSPGRNMWAKALSSLWLSWELLMLLFQFYTFCGTEPCHIPTSPSAGLALLGDTLQASNYFRKGCLHNLITSWYSHIPKGKVTLQFLLYADKFDFMPLDAHSCISSSSSSPEPISSEPSFLVEVCSSLRQPVSLWDCCKCVPGKLVGLWAPGEVPACSSCSLPPSSTQVFSNVGWMCPAAQRWTES